MKNVRQSNINIHKDAWVEINLEYLAQNILAIKKTIPQGKKLMACQSIRFLPERLAAFDMVQKGESGDIYYAELSRIRRRGIPFWGAFHMKKISFHFQILKTSYIMH